MIIVIQVLAFLYAFRIGVHDAVAVNGFTRCGSNPKEQSQFHSSNWQQKAIVCAGLSLPFYPHYLSMAIAFIMCGLIVWIVFDPVVARYRMNKQAWYYLTTGNLTDRFLLKVFGKYAGAYKFILVTALVIILNILLLYSNKLGNLLSC
jgi:hypothetical protein